MTQPNNPLPSELDKLISTIKSCSRMILRDDPIGSYWTKDDDGKKVLERIYADGDNYWAITTEELKKITVLFEQEYLRRVEVAKPTREDESPVDVVTGRRVETYGYEVTHNSAIDQYEHNLKQLSGGERHGRRATETL